MTKDQKITVLSEQVRLDQFAHWVNQLAERHFSHRCEVMECESSSKSGGERRGALGGRGHPSEPPPHAVTYAMRKSIIDEGGAARVERDEPVVLETAAELDQKEGVPLDPAYPL